ncbi:extracellular solute-binding protein [Kribbella sancticallisti]|uniref:Extracellular solute-binding protein n=1 Tax=Kribbella sancticallisti TaxID=460087 RepID=A0ABP4QP10_9ACTN
MHEDLRPAELKRRSFVAGALGIAATAGGSGLLSGCSSGEATAEASAETLNAPSVQLAPPKTGINYPPGYIGPVARRQTAIVNEPVTFTVVVPQNLTVGDWSKNEFTRWMEQQTGIRIQFRQVAGTGDDPETMTKVNAMMAAGDIPDAFLGISFTRSQLYLYGAQNLFVDLTPYLDKYAPNLQEAMQDYPQARKLMVSPDKGIYSFPDINDCYHCRASNGRTLLNSEWLRKVGLATPTTTDEFREVLTAFKKADLGGRGKTIPFGGYKDAPLDTYFMNAFLYNPGDPWLVVTDGKVEATYVQDEWREALKYLHGLYADGLLAKDIFTATEDQMKRYGNSPGGPILGGARAYYWGSFLTIDQEDPNARWHQYETMAPLKGPGGVQFAAWDYLKVGVEVSTLVITRKCKRPDLLVRWADFQLDLEVVLRSYAGPDFRWSAKGDKGINGKQSLYGFDSTWNSDSTKGKTWDQYGVMYRSGDFRLGERVNPRKPTFESPLYEQTRDQLFAHKQPMERQFPPVTLEADQAAQDAEIGLNLKGEVTSSLAKFVTGKLDPNDDGQWRDYTGRIRKIGLAPYLDIQQAAYETYQG